MSVRIIAIENSSCLSCDKIEKDMVKIGAFVMCPHCKQVEFGDVREIDDPTSELYNKVYLKWLKKYKQTYE